MKGFENAQDPPYKTPVPLRDVSSGNTIKAASIWDDGAASSIVAHHETPSLITIDLVLSFDHQGTYL